MRILKGRRLIRFLLLGSIVTTLFFTYSMRTLWSDDGDAIGREDTVNFESFYSPRNEHDVKMNNPAKKEVDDKIEAQKSNLKDVLIDKEPHNNEEIQEKVQEQKSVDKISTHKKESEVIKSSQRHSSVSSKEKQSENIGRNSNNLNTSLAEPVQKPIETGSPNCFVDIYPNLKHEPPPFKIFIYDLPSKFHSDMIRCMSHMPELQYCGFGPLMYEENHGNVSMRNSWQFSLDIIIHHKLMFSPYRTLDPREADVFYIPFYEASHCFCKWHNNVSYNGMILEKAVFHEISKLPYYKLGKPHLLTIAKIEREETGSSCPLLKEEWTKSVLLIGIEANDRYRFGSDEKNRFSPFLNAPYPSYAHFHSPDGGGYHETIFSSKRRVFIFMAAGSRRSNPFRNNILDMFPNKTSKSIDDYYLENGFSPQDTLRSMWLVTPERIGPHQPATMHWMKNAVFCLQPPGDSPTRKSMYDCILSGCIPVFFHWDYTPHVTYPFMDVFNYTEFSVTVPSGGSFWDTLEPYEKDPSLIARLQRYLYDVIPYMQYSYPIDNRPHTDAMLMILNQVGRHFGLQDNRTGVLH